MLHFIIELAFLYIAKDLNFSQMVVNTGSFLNPGGTYGTYNLATQDIGQSYYWKMAAMNVYGYSPFSATWSVVNGPSTAPPSTPTLWYPYNGVDVNDTELTLMWYADRATDYYLQVATTPQFTDSTIVFGKWIGNNDTYLIGGLLNYGETYSWRVKAKNSYGESSYSSYQSFRYYDSLTCTSTYGSGIGVTNNSQSHIDTCYTSDGSYYLYDVSRRTGQQAGHDHTGAMNSAAAIKTKHFFGLIYDADNVWSNNPNYELRPLVDGHVYAARVYDYLYDNTINPKGWSLNSYDGLGSSMVSTAEKPCYDTNKTNANWDGAKVIYYTSCDGAAKSYAGALDLVADAWGDAVTAKASGLYLQYESGALRIAFSDWLGATVENYYDPGVWNWTIGEDILNIQRDLSNPKTYSHPDTYNGLYYYDTENCTPTESNDHCYIHTNSGVPNKMFYLLSQGGTLNGMTVQGIGITEAMRIAYIANRDHWLPNATFHDALSGMIEAANNDANIITQVKNAWAAVGAGLPIISTSASPAVGGMTTGGGDFEWGQSVRVTATPNTGYAFEKWTEDGFTVSNDPSGSYTFTVDGSRNLVANFVEQLPYATVDPTNLNYGYVYKGQSSTIYFTMTNTGGGLLRVNQASLSSGSPDFSISYDGCTGAELSASAVCLVGVTFAPTSGGAKSGNLLFTFLNSSNPSLNIPLSGTGQTLVITATGGTGGSISPSGVVSVNYGASQAFTVTPNTGYHIESVTGCGGALSDNTYTTGAVTADCTVTASFAINTYTVTPSAGANGSISPSIPQTVNYGSTISFTLAPNTGYHIASATGCGGTLSENTYTTGSVTANCTVEAIFSNTYTVIPSAGLNGSISLPTPQPVGYNGTVSFTVSPDGGYHIASVTGCGGTLTDNIYTTGPITEDCTVTATFAINTYTLSISRSGSGAGTITSAPAGISCGYDCTETYNYGTSVTLDVIPGPGTTFAGWSGGGCSGTGNCTVTLTNDTVVTASFTVQATAVTTVSAGGLGNAALRGDGTRWAWGENIDGMIGDGTQIDKLYPEQVGTDTDWSSVSLYYHATAIKTDGTLWAWGYNYSGQIGDGTKTDKYSPVRIGNETSWAAASSGYEHTVALRTDGTLWAWGANFDGQLGDGTTDEKLVPVQIGTGTDWLAVSAGGYHTVALKKDGTLWAWGYNAYGQLGDGTQINKLSPVKIGTDADWAAISAGWAYTMALKTDGTLWAWGSNSYGNLGDGTTNEKHSPIKIGTATDWSAISGGSEHTVAIKTDGTLWAWGYNEYGQLGDGTTSNKLTPVQIGSNTDWAVVSAGTWHTAALKRDGTLWTWGANWWGQIGDGTTTDRYSPVWILGRNDLPRTLTATAGSNGSISPSGPTAINYGGSQTFTIASDPGYHIADIKVDGVSQGIIGSYTFSNVTLNHTIEAIFAVDPRLTAAKSGIGSGTITSLPSGLSCGSACSSSFNYGTSVTLTATLDANSTFTGWSGGGCSGTGDCTVTMTADTNITATFGCSASPIRILGKADYSTLQAAYNAAVDGDTILSRGITLTGNISADMNKSVTIEGGYTCDYSSSPGVTSLSGSMSINNGTVDIKSFSLQY